MIIKESRDLKTDGIYDVECADGATRRLKYVGYNYDAWYDGVTTAKFLGTGDESHLIELDTGGILYAYLRAPLIRRKRSL